jgi:hypothetical protein
MFEKTRRNYILKQKEKGRGGRVKHVTNVSQKQHITLLELEKKQ